MKDLFDILLKEQQELMDIINRTTLTTKNAPKGLLRIAYRNNAIQYYHRTEENDKLYKGGKYIRAENKKLAQDLAQKGYDLSVLDMAKKKFNLIQKFLMRYQLCDLEAVYGELNPCRRPLVTPRVISDEDYINGWNSVKYEGKGFTEGVPELYTSKGEQVRSKSEKIIADMLLSAGIPYRYEYPLVLQGLGTVYPDFTVLNIKERRELYWEHMGMMDHEEYREHALHRIDIYIRNNVLPGDRLIITHETSKRPLETGTIEKVIQHILLNNPVPKSKITTGSTRK